MLQWHMGTLPETSTYPSYECSLGVDPPLPVEVISSESEKEALSNMSGGLVWVRIVKTQADVLDIVEGARNVKAINLLDNTTKYLVNVPQNWTLDPESMEDDSSSTKGLTTMIGSIPYTASSRHVHSNRQQLLSIGTGRGKFTT